MADKYIVKWQVQDLDEKWAYRYIRHFEIECSWADNTPMMSDYTCALYPEGAVQLPEAVAEWLCKLLEAEDLHPEMEKI